MNKLFPKFPALLLALIVGIIASPSAFGAATIVIQNADPVASATTQPIGFNDPTPVAPVGGNGGTTLGQQRLNAFQFAANVWGATLPNGPTITVRANWAHLTCTSSSAVLGSAGATTTAANFPGAPYGDTLYSAALANAIAGVYLNGTSPEITAHFNVDLGNTGCLDGRHWYLGLDGNHGSDLDLVTVLIHEFAHGLGFQTFTNASTGVQAQGLPSIYDRFLLDNSTGKTWVQMTDAERAASSINTDNLVWIGPQATSDAHTVLLPPAPRLKVNSPAPIAGSYRVGTADFGPPLSTSGVTANVVQALDPSDSAGVSTTDGCSPLTNAASVSGNVALIDRGNCTFVTKVKNAQDAGAMGVLIADNAVNSSPPGLGHSDPIPTITIPSVGITQAVGNAIKAQLTSGVNATLFLDNSVAPGADSSGHPLLFTPNPFQSGSSVSHWDTSAFPNQLMEPNISSDLSHSVTLPKDLTFSLLKDIGWSAVNSTPPPPPPPPPANDNFANAQVISGCTGSTTGTNISATREGGEPSHDPLGTIGGASVWYQWQAIVSGSVTITTAGSSFDTMLGVYTGNAVNSLALINNNDDVSGSDNTSSVQFDAVAGTTYRIAVDGWGGDAGNIKLNWTAANCTQATTVQLSQSSYTVGEGDGHAAITVNRSDTTTAATVGYVTSDTAGLTNCNVAGTGIASSRCDYAVSVGTLRFAIGESSKTISIPVVDDNFTEGDEAFTITLSNPSAGTTLGSITQATVTITDNASAAGNPVDQTPFFVRQHYIDFLGREPDPPGFRGWQAILNNCAAGDTSCDRIQVSSGFFRSAEFQERGYFTYRFYSVALGRKPNYAEFMPDLAKVSGFLTDAEKEANKVAFVQEFMARPAFQTKYGSLSDPTAYVDALLSTAGLPTHSLRVVWITGLTSSTLTRADVLRQLAESTEAYNKFYNQAFVVMQYFGYLRRDPDSLYLKWIEIIDGNGGDYRNMVNGFMNSAEYRQRFAP
jgi:hypothetical protein